MIHQVSLDEAVALAKKERSFSATITLLNPPEEQTFDGETYDETKDKNRLQSYSRMVWDLMKDGKERTPKQIKDAIGLTWDQVNPRLRDFRKAKFGGHKVPRRSLGNGLFAYRLIINPLSERPDSLPL